MRRELLHLGWPEKVLQTSSEPQIILAESLKSQGRNLHRFFSFISPFCKNAKKAFAKIQGNKESSSQPRINQPGILSWFYGKLEKLLLLTKDIAWVLGPFSVLTSHYKFLKGKGVVGFICCHLTLSYWTEISEVTSKAVGSQLVLGPSGTSQGYLPLPINSKEP